MKWNRSTAILSAGLLLGLVFSGNMKSRLFASPQAPAKSAPSGNDPASVGSWSAPINIGMVPIHAALLHNSQVLFWQYSSSTNSNPGTTAMLFNPATQTATSIATAPTADYFCSGATQLPNGQLIIDGGLSGKIGSGDNGTNNATIYDPVANTFTQQPSMAFDRYYPTNIAMPDGIQLVVSGQNAKGVIVPQLEKWNTTSSNWTELPTYDNLPASVQPWNNYPRMFVLPSTNPNCPSCLYVANQLYHTWYFNPAATMSAWTFIGDYNEVYRFRGAQVLMPDLQTVMVMGGQQPNHPPTNTTETINLAASTPAWSYGTPMNFARHDLNAVQLPDGTILAIGGASGSGDYTNPVEAAELYTPSTKQWTVLASQLGSRGYHSTALLLPNGTVISEGSDSGTQYQNYVEVFSPPYLFKGAQPVISSAPAFIKYGQVFNVSTPNASTISSVALIRLDALTHADHMDQRMLNLTFATKGGSLQITPPANSNSAPPGFYMLFIVNTSGVPSIAKILQVTSGTAGT